MESHGYDDDMALVLGERYSGSHNTTGTLMLCLFCNIFFSQRDPLCVVLFRVPLARTKGSFLSVTIVTGSVQRQKKGREVDFWL